MRNLRIDNYIIETPLFDILTRLRLILTNDKLKDITVKGDDIWVTCPNRQHANGQEHKAGCCIYIGDRDDLGYGTFHCFVCGFKGSFAKFVGECFDRSEIYGKKWLIDNYGKLAFENTIDLEPITLHKKEEKQILDKSILETYQNYCPYLQQRKLSREVCEKFNVKYDPNLRQVIFPCYDIKDNLVMLVRRNIDFKNFIMDKNCAKPVYNLNYVMKNNIKTVAICEGPIDALSIISFGLPAIATLGKPSLEQIEQINKSSISVLYIMFDNDEAGRSFTRFLKANLAKRILTIDVKLPAGKKDANDLTKEEFDYCIKNSI